MPDSDSAPESVQEENDFSGDDDFSRSDEGIDFSDSKLSDAPLPEEFDFDKLHDLMSTTTQQEEQKKQDGIPDTWDKTTDVDISQLDADIVNSDFDVDSEGGGGGWTNQFEEHLVPYFHEGKRLAIPTRWYHGSIVKRILTHNKAHGFTGCVLIGMSGSGKTTLTQSLIHRIHYYDQHYIVKWFNGREMMNLDKHIKKMQEGQPHILIFDDASYTMENAGKEDLARLGNALTTIRHQVKSRVIMIMNIHYSKATKKFFRNQHFTFLTSITTEELGNLKDLFQDKMPIIRQFGKRYRQMALLGHFFVPLGMHTGKAIKYKINDPFRIGLVSELTDIHFFVYPREDCNICHPKKKYVTSEEAGKKVLKILSEKVSPTRMAEFVTVLEFWLHLNNYKNQKWLNNRTRGFWNLILKMQEIGPIPWDYVYGRFGMDTWGKKTGTKVRRHYINNLKKHATEEWQKEQENMVTKQQETDKKDDAGIASLVEQLKTETEKNKVGVQDDKYENETKSSGYDSTYHG